MKRYLLIIYAILLLLPMLAGAQTISNAERRHINFKVLSLIEEYERLASLYDEESQFYFESLFEKGPESMVFCDMIGSESYLNSIPVSEYIHQLSSYASTVTTVIKDVRKGSMTYVDGKWHIPVIMKKSFEYIDKDGYVFSVADYHKSDVDIRINVIYDQESDVCAITSIEGAMESDKSFPEGRFLIVNKSNDISVRYQEYLSSLKIGDDNVVFNEFGQAVLPSGEPSVDDIDVKVMMDTLSKGFNYDVVNFAFKQRKTRMKLRYGYSPNAFNVVNNSELMDVKSPAMELGFDIGFAAKAGRKSKFGLYTGVGVMKSDLNMTQTTSSRYNYYTSKINDDKIWDHVNVAYTLKSATESVSYLDLFVPVYFEFEHGIGKYVMISWNLGAKGYYNLNASPTDHNVSFHYTISDTNASGDKSLVKKFDTSFYQTSPFDVSVFGNLGIDLNILKKKIYLMLRAGYEYGIMTTFKSNLASYYQADSPASHPIIYDAVQDQHIVVHPMINGLEFSRRGWWFSGGFKFKL